MSLDDQWKPRRESCASTKLKKGLSPFVGGYRVYFGVDGNVVVLLNGGDKASQSRDIRRAKEYWTDYNA